MTDMEKLKQAQSLLSDVYHKYGELWSYDSVVSRNMSVADSCIIEAMDSLDKFVKEIV